MLIREGKLTMKRPLLMFIVGVVIGVILLPLFAFAYILLGYAPVAIC